MLDKNGVAGFLRLRDVLGIMDEHLQPSDGCSASAESAFTQPRNFLGNQFVYAVISARAKGLSIGVNMAPDGLCSFDCAYCEVDHSHRDPHRRLDMDVLSTELQNMVAYVRSGEIRKHSYFGQLPSKLLELRHVALSGNGEPTLCRDFTPAVISVMHVRATSPEFFKVALLTNGSGLHMPEVQSGLRYFTPRDEIWIKLDAGTQAYAEKINHLKIPLTQVLNNIRTIGRQRAVTIQSLFPSIDGQAPPQEEIDQYVWQLGELKRSGAAISQVQIYSATRPSRYSTCGHLPLRTLMGIAKRVRETTGINAEVF